MIGFCAVHMWVHSNVREFSGQRKRKKREKSKKSKKKGADKVVACCSAGLTGVMPVP